VAKRLVREARRRWAVEEGDCIDDATAIVCRLTLHDEPSPMRLSSSCANTLDAHRPQLSVRTRK